MSSRIYRPSWDPCVEVKNKTNSVNTNPDEIATTKIKTIAKAYRKELPEIKEIWKSYLPYLSTKDVRRYRVPHDEVTILELEEADYKDAAQYMKMLFSLDENIRIKAGPGTTIWTNPRLKDRVDLVNRLKTGLAEANRWMIEERRVSRIAALLETALYFQNTSWEWWWIAEQLFISVLKVSEDCIEDDNETGTMVKYLYARFLFNEMKDSQGCLKFLNQVRIASKNKRWNASKILGIKQDNLFRESCILLYRVQLSLAKIAQEENPDSAIEACQNAIKYAMDADHDAYITNATCELGRNYIRANQANLAVQNFVKCLNLSREISDYEGICNAHMELAFAYKELGDRDKTMKELELFRETASRFQLPFKLAQAHYHIGEHLLSQNHLTQATSHLEFSFTLYYSMGKTTEANQARCIAAVSKGQELLDQFIDQIIRCGKYDEIATTKLCNWKNNRSPFWKIMNEDENYGEDWEHEEVTRGSHTSDYEYETHSSQSELVEIHRMSTSSLNSGDLVPEVIHNAND